MEPYREALAIAVQQVEEEGMVVVRMENDLAVMSAVRDVVIGRGRALLLAR
jgi:vancomycin permeability regulator SanA